MQFTMALKELQQEIIRNEGEKIKDKKIAERRDWIQRQKIEFGKIPADLEKYYEQFEAGLDIDEEIKRRLEEEEAEEVEEKKVKAIKKEAKKTTKKGKNRLMEEEEEGAETK